MISSTSIKDITDLTVDLCNEMVEYTNQLSCNSLSNIVLWCWGPFVLLLALSLKINVYLQKISAKSGVLFARKTIEMMHFSSLDPAIRSLEINSEHSGAGHFFDRYFYLALISSYSLREDWSVPIISKIVFQRWAVYVSSLELLIHEGKITNLNL